MQDREPDEFRESTSFFQIWLLFRQNRVALFWFCLFCLLILTALFPKLIMPYSESMEFVGEELMPPSWVEKGRIAFFFGTDDLGRDVLSRLLMGTQYTLGSSLLVVIAVAIIGGALVSSCLNVVMHPTLNSLSVSSISLSERSDKSIAVFMRLSPIRIHIMPPIMRFAFFCLCLF